MFTYIARLRDRLLLCTCLRAHMTHCDRQHLIAVRDLFMYFDEDTKKPVIRRRGVLDDENFVTCYIGESGFFYFATCEKPVTKTLMISYLEEIKREFISRYSSICNIISGPLALFEFAPYMWEAASSIMDSITRYNLGEIDQETGEVCPTSPSDRPMLTADRVLSVDAKAGNMKSQAQE